MEYRIIKGMEDPVRVKGFLLAHFYILLAAGLFGCLLILGSVSSCLQAGSVTPLLKNSFLAVLLMLTAFTVLRRLSGRRKFPSMGKGAESSNVPLHRRLHPDQLGISLTQEEARRMKEISDMLRKDPSVLEEGTDSAEFDDLARTDTETRKE